MTVSPALLLCLAVQLSLGTLLDAVQEFIAGFIRQIPYIVLGILIVIIFLVVARVIGRLFREAGAHTRLPPNVAAILGRIISTAVIVLGLFVAAVVVFPAFKPGDLVTGLGITSVALGFALKDVLQNFVAGILILWRQPFVVGDQISTRGFSGTVEEVNMRSTRIKTYDGCRVILPNGDVYVNPIQVFTAFPQRRITFTVGIGYPDSIEKARKVIHDLLARTEGVLPDPSPLVYVSELAGSSVNFTVYFWVESHQANAIAVSDRVATGIKLSLDEAHIDMPYPHTVVLFDESARQLFQKDSEKSGG